MPPSLPRCFPAFPFLPPLPRFQVFWDKLDVNYAVEQRLSTEHVQKSTRLAYQGRVSMQKHPTGNMTPHSNKALSVKAT